MRINTETSVGLFVLAALAIFFYMTFQIGVFRADTSSYRTHTIYFKDLSGLSKKAEVKIAGVKVGWVDKVGLVQGNKNYKAKAKVKVHKDYKLRSDAQAVVRQDGLLGVKFLEVAPGDPLLPIIKSGEALTHPGKSPASIDSMIREFQMVAENVKEVTGTIKDALSGSANKQRLDETMDNIHIAAERVARFSEVADRIMTRSEDDVQGMISDLRVFAGDLREASPDIKKVLNRLDEETLPAFQRNLDKIGTVFDRDFGTVAGKLESTSDAIEEAALQTRDGFRSIGAVADKINDGKGLIGKLVNDEHTYHDLKVAVQGMKNYFSKVESMGIVFDSHFESMHRPAENYARKNSKGYFDVRVHPNQENFYILQMMGSTKGSVERKIIDRQWFDSAGNELKPNELNISDDYRLRYAESTEETIRKRDAVKYGFQFGKIFSDTAVRFGLIEGSFGFGADYNIPFGTDKFRWVTSLEGFDFRGRSRLDDSRPHLKWINRIFLLRNIYVDFGADDFVSKHNSNTFFGGGIRFSDDDIKYFASSLGLGGKG